MGSVRHRARPVESAIGICLLAVLVLIAIGVLIKQSDADLSRFGLDADAASLSLQQPQADREIQLALESLTPSGFKTLSRTEVYETENLYEKINGKAPLYTESGFVKLSTRRFVSEADESLWMELYLYDMAAISNAFSVYSVQRRAEVEIVPDLQFAYATTSGLYFVHGKYYVELLGSSESSDLLRAMTEVLQNITSQLPAVEIEQIAELSLFPKENLVPGSCKLYLANAFGFDGLTDTFVAKYRAGDETVTAFLCRRSDATDARATAKSYCDFLVKNDAEVRAASEEVLKENNAKVFDFYGTTEIVFAAGTIMGGIHEAEDRPAAEKLAVRLIDKFANASGRK
jgi:hypothetical protein